MTTRSRVETVIDIEGNNKASKAVREARAGIDDLGERSGDIERALLGTRDLLGDAFGEPLKRLGDVAGGLEGVIKGLPGPIGIAAGAVGLLGAGAFLVYDHFRKAAATIEQLGAAGADDLRQQLDLSAEAAASLSQALADLPVRLRPAQAVLADVRDRAEAIGKDGEEAVGKFVSALAQGPEALRSFEREFGKLARATDDLPSVAERLGLSQQALGLVRDGATEAERAKAAASEAVLQERQRQAVLTVIARLDGEIAGATARATPGLQAQRESLVAQAEALREVVGSTVAEANALQDVVSRQRAATDASKARQESAAAAAASIAVAEAEAGVLLDAREGAQQRLGVLVLRQAEIDRQRVELQRQATAGVIAEGDHRKALTDLRGKELSLAAAELALGKQAQQERSQRSAAARAAADGELAARIRLATVEATAAEQSVNTLGDVTRLRLDALALQERAERSAAGRAANTASGRAVALLAIEGDFAARRRALAASTIEAERAGAEQTRQLVEASNARSAQLAKESADAIVGAAAARSSRLADAARAEGDIERATLIERRQAWADYQQAVVAIQDQLAAKRAAVAAGSVDASNVEAEARAREAAAAEGYAARIARADSERAQAQAAAVQSTISAISGPVVAAAGAANSKIGEAISIASQGAQAVGQAWGSFAAAAPAAISAAGGVAAAFVDGERGKATVLAISETAASVASFASGNVAGGFGHAASAALYGSIAGGLVGGAGGASGSGGIASSASAGVGGAPPSPSAVGGAGTGSGGGGAPIVVNFNATLTTRAEVAKGVAKATRALRGTGFAA